MTAVKKLPKHVQMIADGVDPLASLPQVTDREIVAYLALRQDGRLLLDSARRDIALMKAADRAR